jgi:LysM repeat protein
MFLRLVLVLGVALLVWAVLVRPSEGAGHERTYLVKPADTLWSIAVAHYGGDPREAVWRLQQRNGLEGTLLHPGQRLVLPRS